MKKIFFTLGLLVLFVVIFSVIKVWFVDKQQISGAPDPLNAEYVIEGVKVRLVNGVSETPAIPNVSSLITTKYFGNELVVDLNKDGRDDVVFFLTQDGGGTGLFYYVVAAMNLQNGYFGSEGIFIGDRISPQTIESTDTGVVVNYVDRARDESFSAVPSLAQSIWLRLDTDTLTWGEVAQNFEGEANPELMTLPMKPWRWSMTISKDGTKNIPRNPGAFSVTFSDDNKVSIKTDCNGMSGTYKYTKDTIVFGLLASTQMYCEGSQESEFVNYLTQVQRFKFTSKGELVLELTTGDSVIFN